MVPFAWDGTAAGLPSNAVKLVSSALDARDRGVAPTALGALEAVVPPSYQGRGHSRSVLLAMAEAARRRGLTDLLAAIRPTAKHRYPLVALGRYARWRRADGRPFDPWMCVHGRLGATPVGVARAWTVVEGDGC